MNIIIDGVKCEVKTGEYILDAAERNGIHIPALCHNEALPGQGVCRLCIVEVVEGKRRKIVTSCIFPIQREIEVVTNSERVRAIRKTIIMLLSARIPGSQYLNKLKEEYGVEDAKRFKPDMKEECILCGLCVRACEEMGSCAISTVNRGITKKVSTPYDEPSSVCIGCGACAYVCPTGAIKVEEVSGKRFIWNKEFELLKCSACGEYFTTPEQAEYVRKKLGTDKVELLCPKCKKVETAEKLRDIYEGTGCK